MTIRQVVKATAVVFAVALFAGRSVLADDTLAPATGQVTVNGNPLAKGRIFFLLDDGQFVGSKIKDGSYKVSRVPVGVCRVAIEGAGVPEKFASDETSPLTVTVKAAGNTVDFDLKAR